MKFNSTIFQLVLAGFMLIASVGCKKEIPRVIPVLTTAMVTNISSTSVTCGGEITSDGGAAVTSRGVCWSTDQLPKISDSKTSDGTGTGSFISPITGLTPGATYYIRAYATNSVGTAYGDQVTATTATILATLTTTAASAVTATTVSSGGNITGDGGGAVTARGVCWSTSQNPTIADSKTSDGTGNGSFTSSVTGLTPGATYYIRAYTTNSAGTAYGNQVNVTTPAILATITTTAVSAVTATTLTSGGNITGDGGGAVTAKGVCWSTSQNPTIADSKTSDGTGTGSFTSSVVGLTPVTTYYFRAYATNSAGTAYGKQMIATSSSPDSFIITIKTDNPGSSGSNQITIPTSGSGYNVTIDWGDASSNNYSGTPGDILHTYSVSGTFDVRISGTFPTIKFNNGGDRLKLLSIEQWGNNIWSTFNSSFYGCENLVIHATDLPHSGSVNDFGYAWYGCKGLTSFPLINTSAGTDFEYAWFFCNSLTSFPLIDAHNGTVFRSTWDNCSGLTSFPLINTSAGTDFFGTWINCNKLTSFPLINTSAGTNFFGTWYGCKSLISFPSINTSSGTNFSSTWEGCNGLTSFPQLNMNKMTQGDRCFYGVTLQTVTYSNLLIDLAVHNSNNGVLFGAGNSKYNSAAVASRAILTTSPRNWVITDGGLQ